MNELENKIEILARFMCDEAAAEDGLLPWDDSPEGNREAWRAMARDYLLWKSKSDPA